MPFLSLSFYNFNAPANLKTWPPSKRTSASLPPSPSDFIFKFVIVGDLYVGKSAILIRFAVRPPSPRTTNSASITNLQ